MKSETGLSLLIEQWDESHPRWQQLMAFVADQGQANWLTFTAGFHISSHVLVALSAGEIVGFLRYVIQEVGPELDRPALLRDGVALIEAKVLAFAVASGQQRQGIGTTLQVHLLRLARQQGCYQIRSHSSGPHSANHELKFSLGFGVHPIIREDDDEGAYFIMPLELPERIAKRLLEVPGAPGELPAPAERPGSVQIRHATVADVPALCDLYLEFHEYHAAAVPARLQSLAAPDRFNREEVARKIGALLQEQDAQLVVAELGGRIVGLSELYVREDDGQNPAVVARRYAHLQSLMVTAAARRHGAGRALLEAAEAWALQNGAEEVRVDIWEFAGGPLAFYEGAGYRTLKRTLVRGLRKRTSRHEP